MLRLYRHVSGLGAWRGLPPPNTPAGTRHRSSTLPETPLRAIWGRPLLHSAGGRAWWSLTREVPGANHGPGCRVDHARRGRPRDYQARVRPRVPPRLSPADTPGKTSGRGDRYCGSSGLLFAESCVGLLSFINRAAIRRPIDADSSYVAYAHRTHYSTRKPWFTYEEDMDLHRIASFRISRVASARTTAQP